MRSRRLAAPLAALALLAGALAVVASLTKPADRSAPTAPSPATTNASGFDGAAIPPPSPPAPDFTLTDQHGHAVSLRELRGHVVALTFLYSTCGATCTLIAQQIRGALDELGHAVPVLIISADPRADTHASVAHFLAEVSLSRRVSYLTGSPAQLRRVWRAYRVHPASAGRAVFDKYAFLLLIDASGRERVLFEPEVLTPEGLAHDLRRLWGG